MTLHVITGAPLSGKSTYIAEHRKEGDVVVDFDALAVAIGCASHDITEPYGELTKGIRQQLIDECAAKGYEAWIHHCDPSPERLAWYEEHGAEIVHLECTREECEARADAIDAPQYRRDAIERYFDNQEKARTMTTKYKSVNFAVKAADEGGDGSHIVAYASTFDREPDSYGDIIAKGAFVDCLAKLDAKGQKLPVLFGHRCDDPMMNIGIVNEAHEDERGLLCDITLDMGNPNAAYCAKLVSEGRLCKLSFAYDVLDYCYVQLENGFNACELRKLDVYEVSLVPIPANQHAEVVDQKSGRRNSAADEGTIREVIKLLNALLGEEEQEEADTEEPKEGQADANGEEPDQAKEKAAHLLEYIDRMNKKEV